MKLLILIGLLICWPYTTVASSVGFQQFELNDDPQRPLPITVWYPTQQKAPPELVGDNLAFVGTKVVKDASTLPHKSPFVLLSHGYRGNWRNLNWLATELAQKGMVVAAPDHPGTTTFDHSPQHASLWWQRPRDLVRILDHFQTDPTWRSIIDRDNVSAIGHSLGGWSVMQLAGAQFDRNTFHQHCRQYPNPKTCGLKNELGLASPQPNEPAAFHFYEPRIKKTVILDLGLARSFSTSSLSKVNTPTLILAAGIDIGDLPQAQESGYLAEHLPLVSRRYKVYEQAMHFSFMQLCKEGAAELLEKETTGDGIVCKDGANTTRRALHQTMFDDIWRFITKSS